MAPGREDPLRRAHEERARLRGVVAHTRPSPAGPYARALTLSFDEVSLILVAEGDDSLTITDGDGWRPDPDLVPISLLGEEPWSLAAGKPLLWSWSMTNQQGYRDGLQLELADDVDDTSVVIQLMVIASTIKIRYVDEEFVPLSD